MLPSVRLLEICTFVVPGNLYSIAAGYVPFWITVLLKTRVFGESQIEMPASGCTVLPGTR